MRGLFLTWESFPGFGFGTGREGDHGELGEAFGDDGDGFIVSHEPAIAAEPRECALDHPPSPDNLEAGLLVGALDDLQIDRLAGQSCLELRPA